MARNGLSCADVPLRNYLLTHWTREGIDHLVTLTTCPVVYLTGDIWRQVCHGFDARSLVWTSVGRATISDHARRVCFARRRADIYRYYRYIFRRRYVRTPHPRGCGSWTQQSGEIADEYTRSRPVGRRPFSTDTCCTAQTDMLL